MHRVPGLLILLTGLLQATAAFGVNVWFNQDTSTHGFTAASGPGGDFLDILVGTGNTALNELQFYEKSDDPREIFALGRPVSNIGTQPANSNGSIRLAGGASRSGQTLSIVNGYITAVQVCLNKDETKIKGAKIWGSTLNVDGTFDRETSTRKFERPNCYKWSRKVACGPQKIATGLRGYHTLETFGFHGLALRCTKMVK